MIVLRLRELLVPSAREADHQMIASLAPVWRLVPVLAIAFAMAIVVAQPARAQSSGRTPPAERTADPLFGPDKVKHFFISAFVESVAFASLRAVGADRGTALVGGVAAASAAAVGREIYDGRTKGRFSVPDLIWDGLGIGAAFVVLAQTQR